MKKFITDLFTENDGVSWCLVRVSAAPTIAVMLYKLIMSGGPYGWLDFGGGIAAILAAIGFKQRMEK